MPRDSAAAHAGHDVLPGWAFLAIYAAGFVITARIMFTTSDGEDRAEEDRAEWLDIDGWACTPGCPDDMCRSMGTCAWPPAPIPQLIIRPGLSLTDDQVADLRERFEVAMKNPLGIEPLGEEDDEDL